MNVTNKLWFSLTVLLLAAWACLVEASHTEDRMKRSVSASRLTLGRSRRMIGGSLAPYVPWQAMVYLSDSILDGGYAGGALISDRWVLTAGRNVFVRKGRQNTNGTAPVIPKVYLGILRLAEANASNEFPVEKVVLHPGFQSQSDWDNDLALIQLKEPVVMSDKVTPIPLQERDEYLKDNKGGVGVIAGWGWGIYQSLAEHLKYLELPLVTNGDCKAEFDGSPHTPLVDNNMFCTGKTKHEQNVCFGDAGGALAVTDARTGGIYAAGILSYDKSCRGSNYAVYMKLSSYLPWIHSVTRGDTEDSFRLRAEVMHTLTSEHH